MGDASAAIVQVKSMLKGTPDDREVYIALAQMYSRIKDWPQAEANINKAMELSTKQEDKDYVIFVAGSIYERQKKYDLAEESFHKVLADDPKNAQALNYLGYMLADRGTRLEEALGYIRRAVALDPAEWRLSRFAGLGLLPHGQLRSGGREPAPGLGEDWQRSHRSGAPGRAVSEDRPPETGHRPTGSARWKSGTRPSLPKLTPTKSPKCRRNWNRPK